MRFPSIGRFSPKSTRESSWVNAEFGMEIELYYLVCLDGLADSGGLGGCDPGADNRPDPKGALGERSKGLLINALD